MSLFDIFRDFSQTHELQRLADVSGYLKIQSKLAEARDHQERMTAKKRIDELETEVAQLTIVLEAMIEKFYESGLLDSDQLASKIVEIDMRDGVADGKITKPKPSKVSTSPKTANKAVKLKTQKVDKPEVKFRFKEPERKPFSKDTKRPRKF